jgi:hypothetical protein
MLLVEEEGGGTLGSLLPFDEAPPMMPRVSPYTVRTRKEGGEGGEGGRGGGEGGG